MSESVIHIAPDGSEHPTKGNHIDSMGYVYPNTDTGLFECIVNHIRMGKNSVKSLASDSGIKLSKVRKALKFYEEEQYVSDVTKITYVR